MPAPQPAPTTLPAQGSVTPQTAWYGGSGPASTDNSKPLFDDKVAAQSEYRYSDSKPEAWLKVIRNYLVGKAWELEPLLKWAEDLGESKITAEMIHACRGHSTIGSCDPARLSRELWSFLNLNVVGEGAREARRTFDAVGLHEGFDAWRRIVGPMAPRTLHRQHGLYSQVHTPAKASTLRGVEAATIVWEHDPGLYCECGGSAPPEAEKIIIANKMLPNTTPTDLRLSLRKVTSYEEWKRNLKEQLMFLKDSGVTTGVMTSSGVGVHVLDQEDGAPPREDTTGDDEDEIQDVPTLIATMSDEQQQELAEMPLAQRLEALAVQRSFQGRFAKGKPKAKARPKAKAFGNRAAMPPRTGAAPPRTGAAGQPRCANCTQTGHATPDCPNARVEFKDRPCFKCGKPGHRQSECRSAALAALVSTSPAARAPVSERVSFALCVEDDDPSFTKVVARRPRGGRSMGDRV